MSGPSSHRLRAAAAVAALAALLLIVPGCQQQPPSRQRARSADIPSPAAGALRLGDALPDFELPDYFTGERVKLSSLLDGKHYVGVIWHSPACPCANNCAEALKQQMPATGYEDVRLIGISSDTTWNSEWYRNDLKAQADAGLPFRVLLDTDAAIMKLYGAERTPTVWLADKEGRIRYWGAPENTLVTGGEGYQFLLKDAVDALRRGEEPKVRRFDPIGCPIDRLAP